VRVVAPQFADGQTYRHRNITSALEVDEPGVEWGQGRRKGKDAENRCLQFYIWRSEGKVNIGWIGFTWCRCWSVGTVYMFRVRGYSHNKVLYSARPHLGLAMGDGPRANNFETIDKISSSQTSRPTCICVYDINTSTFHPPILHTWMVISMCFYKLDC